MRESPPFEVRLHHVDVRRAAIATVAVAAVTAWSVAPGGDGVGWALAVAAVFVLATIAAMPSLARTPRGLLACDDAGWSFAPESGSAVAGATTVALDCGSFLLLRIDSGRDRLWPPVQRRGLAHDWHALRCAFYASPRAMGASPRTISPSR